MKSLLKVSYLYQIFSFQKTKVKKAFEYSVKLSGLMSVLTDNNRVPKIINIYFLLVIFHIIFFQKSQFSASSIASSC